MPKRRSPRRKPGPRSHPRALAVPARAVGAKSQSSTDDSGPRLSPGRTGVGDRGLSTLGRPRHERPGRAADVLV
ncbi:hypothetical protein DBR21_02420 [Caulobacter sp. HMWF009]|nr:hypothetical protein DBR21_02420 [Caulobacter sp. HMWF009]PTT09851.1 hypothetical protein DBR10_06650 [Caulobacter sp. HMWF025]